MAVVNARFNEFRYESICHFLNCLAMFADPWVMPLNVKPAQALAFARKDRNWDKIAAVRRSTRLPAPACD